MIGKKINQLATELAPVSTDLTIIGDPTTGVSKKITLAQLGAIFSGAVSFYTNYAGFPATGDINVIYCAKDTQKLYLWSGSAYVEVFPSQALLDTYQLRSEKGNANGYASLDSQGKVPISQLPSSIMEYKGTWNASTNTPTLANGTGDTGDVYICNVAGTVNFGAGPITFAVGDYVIYSGTIWQRSSGAVGTVTSVAASITGDSVTISGSPVTTSGTLAFAFAGTGAQYIKGDGTLATFPTTIDQAKNLITEVYNSTGATLTKGTVVYINGGQGNLPTVTKALASGDSTSAQTYGIVQNDITNNNNGFVVVAGRLTDIDTQAYSVGTQLYLSSTTAGAYTSTKQYAPAHLVYVGIIVRSHPTQGIIEVKIQNGYELDELHNVAAQTPSNNDGLFYESSTDLWKNKSIATILGYTPQAQLNGTGFVKASGTTITYDNSTYVTTDTFQNISASKTFAVGFNIASAGGTNQISVFANTNSLFSGSGGSNVFGFNSANNIYFGKGLDNGGVLSWNNSAVRYYTLPDATGTIALVGGSGVGTVTSVGLSAPTGFSVSGSPVTSSGTLALSFASGYSLPTDTKQSNWDTAYNSRIVSVVAPLTFSLNTLGITQATGSSNGYLSSADWTTFNNKQSALTNPVTGTGTTNYLPKFTGTSTIGDSIAQDNGSRILINTGTTNQNTTINASKVGMSRTSDGAEVVYFSKNTDLGSDGTANIHGYNGIQFRTQGAESVKATLDASGNLGLGVTPSAGGLSGYVLFELANGGASIYSGANQNLNGTNISWSGGTASYKISNFATLYNQQSGQHQWYTAPSGTAGNAISFTQAMTLDASGRLGIGTTSPAAVLEVAGTSATTDFRISRTVSASTYFYISAPGGSPSTATLGVNGTAVMALNASGNVGIGTTSPLSILNAQADNNDANSGQFVISGATSSLKRLSIGFNTTSNYGFIQPYTALSGYNNLSLVPNGGNVGIGTTSPGGTLELLRANDSGVILRIGNTGSTYFDFSRSSSTGALSIQGNQTGNNNILLAPTSGNVGIGTTSPSVALQVDASGGGIIRATRLGAGSAYIQLEADGTNGTLTSSAALIMNAGGSERMRITGGSGNDLLIGTTSNPYTAASRSSIFLNGTSTSLYGWGVGGTAKGYMYHEGTNVYIENSVSGGFFNIAQVGAGYVSLSTNAAERMRITSGGDVLIGSTGGSHRLTVNVSSGADREMFICGVTGVSNGFRVRYHNASSTVRVSMTSLPTSSSGLSSGDIWNDGGTLKIV
jgi:hypothetical protein